MNQPRQHTELAFEGVIESVLLNTGYIKGNPEDFNRSIAIDAKKLFEFLKSTQEDKWKALEVIHRNGIEDFEAQKERDRNMMNSEDLCWHGSLKCYDDHFH